MTVTVYSNKYEIQEEIAQGGMGIVYKAWDRMLERVVALKVIHQNLAKDSNFLDRFLDEARKMALLHHTNIIQIYSVENDQGMPFLVMEYFPGVNLKTYLRKNNPLSLNESVKIVSQIALALIFTHRKGIIHRDIKPANIILDDSLTVKLTDFGIARALGQTAHTATGQLLGTVKYMSPEQARDMPLDGRSDLYSLGMLFYELVTGENPRNDLTAVGILSRLVTEGHMPSLRFSETLNIPSEIQQIIIDLLQFHPENRIPNAENFIDRLEQSFPSSTTAKTKFHAENTSETKTLSLDHSLKSKANEATGSQGSGAFQSKNIDEGSAFEHQGSMAALQNQQALPLGQALATEPKPKSFLRLRYGILVPTISLLLAIGGYAWHYFGSTAPGLPKDNQLAMTPKLRIIKEEKTTPVDSDSKPNVQVNKGPQLKKFDSPDPEVLPTLSTQISPPAIARPSPSSDLSVEIPLEAEEIQAESPHEIVPPSQGQPGIESTIQQLKTAPVVSDSKPNVQENKGPQPKEFDSPGPEVLPTLSTQMSPPAIARPSPSSDLSTEPLEAEEIQAESAHDIVSSSQGQPESKSTIINLSQVPNSDLSSLEVPPMVPVMSDFPKETIENGLDIVLNQASQESMEAILHNQVEKLQRAIIEKNWDALERLSTMSESRRFWLETLYTKYQSVQIDIAQVATEPTEGKATIYFTKGIRSNGEVVIPNAIGRTIKITIPKNGDEWGRIIW